MQRLRRKIRQGTAAVLLAVLLLYLAVYAGGVLWLRSTVNHRTAAWLGVADSHRLSGSLWPFGLSLSARDVAQATADAGAPAANVSAIVKVGQSSVVVPLLMPWRTVTVLDNVEYTNAQLHLTIGRLTLAAPLYARDVYRSRAKLRDLSIWPAGADTTPETAVRVPQMRLDFAQRLQGHDAAAPEQTLDLTLAPIVLPPLGFKAPAGDAPPLSLDRLHLHATAEPALPLTVDTAAVGAWQAAGGRIELAPLEIKAKGVTTTLTGPVTLDERLAPAGKLTLTITGIDKAYAAFGALGLMPDEQYQALGNLIKLLPGAGSKPFDFPVSLHDDALFFMDGAVFQFHHLPWQAAAPVEPGTTTDLPPGDPIR